MSAESNRRQNLDAMAPSLSARLSAPLPDSRLGTDDTGATTWTRFRRPMVLSDDHCMEAVSQLARSGPPLLLIGLGAGRRLAWLLENTERVVMSCCLLYTSPSPRDLSTSRMPSSA